MFTIDDPVNLSGSKEKPGRGRCVKGKAPKKSRHKKHTATDPELYWAFSTAVFVLIDMTVESGRRFELLNARRLPARLLAEETAIVLGFKEHDIPALVNAGVLKPLAAGPRNCVKYFHVEEVLAIAKDRKAMEKASRAVLRGRNRITGNQAHQPVHSTGADARPSATSGESHAGSATR